MATWFGKYNKNGYANLNNGIGSADDNTSRKKGKIIMRSLLNSVEYFDDDLANGVTRMNAKNGKNVIVNDEYVVTSSRSYELLTQVKKGQNNIAFDCDDETDEYFAIDNNTVFNPDVCDPQTYDVSNNMGSNDDCSNNYGGALLVDENGVEIDSTITHNAVYAEVKEGVDVSLNSTYQIERIVLDGKIYLSGVVDC